MKKKIVLTGSNDQLGNCLPDIAKNYPQYEFMFIDVWS